MHTSIATSAAFSLRDVLALGFMTFALFLGAGNIIFPAESGLQAGTEVWRAAIGFLVTGVGLPLMTVVALARVGGGLATLTLPLGKVAGTVLAVAVYLAIGPFFATPRTAVVSYEIGVVPFFGNSGTGLFVYSTLYFALVLYLAISPNKMIDRIGTLITPVLLIALATLGGAAIFKPAGEVGQAQALYQDEAWLQGFLHGYLTMDALGALAFGVVIATAIRSKGVQQARLITRFSVFAGLIAAVGLSAVYLSLFYLGATSQEIANDAQNGGQVLALYVEHVFGPIGNLLLAVVIGLACLTTAVGLLVACGEFFSERLSIAYKYIVVFFVVFSWAVSNQGLDQLIQISIPVLTGLYPLAIVLVALSLLDHFWRSSALIFRGTMAVTLIFGLVDGLAAAGFSNLVPDVFNQLPLAAQQMGWLVPSVVVMLGLVVVDRYYVSPKSENISP
ncbi:branched-chain amino acid transport system II carrier protein [Denitrificimonas sp. JX-1]|uniref:Branched-chain amino acid transport system carrier protein n=1 Tax=Denitrificimonas halotolerans TaxID=3098930 RepID=A0ABU5GU25_9GAMM|nr:branched-chain amino acid transport system II carrier protein [Denitrificimonas sp. JX-1]MDY7220481.1 branched-chain amino acid transport system II carrier protein [Denitrificimonas sp. JX-1]